jgi:hypothetical protein
MIQAARKVRKTLQKMPIDTEYAVDLENQHYRCGADPRRGRGRHDDARQHIGRDGKEPFLGGHAPLQTDHFALNQDTQHLSNLQFLESVHRE